MATSFEEQLHRSKPLLISSSLSGGAVAEAGRQAPLARLKANLSVHLRKLEDAGYVAIDKSFAGRKPLTRISLTDSGRTAFGLFLEAIGKLIETR